MKTVNKSEKEYISPSFDYIDMCVEGVLCASGDTTTEEWEILDLS